MSDAEQALLEEQHAPWEYVSQLEAGGGDPTLTMAGLLASQQDTVLRTLQTQGVSKLGEFSAPSDVVFPAFGKDPILTLGSPRRALDYEALWGARLRELARGHKPTGWSSRVVVEAFVVNVKGAANADQDGLLQPLLKRWNAGALEMEAFGLPAVQAVVEFKWHTFARRLLLWELAFFLVWLLSFFTFTILFQDEDEKAGLAKLLTSGRGRATVLAEALALLAMTPFLVLEYGTISVYRSGWLNVWNVQDALTYVLQITITLLHLTRNVHSGYLSIACALQCILLLFRLQYFSRVFTATRFAFLEAVKEAISAISIYLFFMVLVILGFAVAFHILFRKDQKSEEFSTIVSAFLTMWANQSGLLDLDLMRSSHNPVTAVLLAVAYSFVMGMVIVNMLIGLMSNALEKTSRHEGTKMLLNKAQIVDELETTLPRWMEDRLMGSPDFIHILRIDPDRLDKPDLGCMWETSGGGDAPVGKDGVNGVSADVAARLTAMQAQLDRLEALLQAGTALKAHPAASATS